MSPQYLGAWDVLPFSFRSKFRRHLHRATCSCGPVKLGLSRERVSIVEVAEKHLGHVFVPPNGDMALRMLSRFNVCQHFLKGGSKTTAASSCGMVMLAPSITIGFKAGDEEQAGEEHAIPT